MGCRAEEDIGVIVPCLESLHAGAFLGASAASEAAHPSTYARTFRSKHRVRAVPPLQLDEQQIGRAHV